MCSSYCSKPSHYAPSNITYAEEMRSQPMYSQPAYSYYPEDEVQHFYKWTSPPGIIKIMSVLIIVMCVGIFACVASTLPWDLEFYGSSSLGSGYCHCLGILDYCGFCHNHILFCKDPKSDELLW
uniref:Uncharacterized protein n=1 Tax=Gopherus evgoodei TaxID=1825980 RepID=A0A8C4VIZ3_9SAUR